MNHHGKCKKKVDHIYTGVDDNEDEVVTIYSSDTDNAVIPFCGPPPAPTPRLSTHPNWSTSLNRSSRTRSRTQEEVISTNSMVTSSSSAKHRSKSVNAMKLFCGIQPQRSASTSTPTSKHASSSESVLMSQTTQLEDENTQLKNENGQLKNHCDRLSKKINDLENNYDNLTIRHNRLVIDHNNLSMNHEQLLLKYQSLRTSHDQLKSLETNLKQQIEKAETTIQEFTEIIGMQPPPLMPRKR